MTNSTSYKVTCVCPDQSPEVRRFLVPQELFGNFKHLQGKLLSVFPKLGLNNFSLFWKDTEGDDITISSDEDLLIALGEMEGSVCKLIVKMKQGTGSEDSSSTSEEDESLHNGEPLSGVFSNYISGNNSHAGQSRNTQQQNTLAMPPLILTILQFLGINPNGFYFFPPSEEVSGSQVNQCQMIMQYLSSQFLRISALFTQVSITLSSITIMLFIMMVLPTFFIHSALYLALANSLGFPLPTLLGGHLLFLLITCTPTFLVFTAAIWAFHRIFVLKKPLVEVDLEFWRRSFESISTHLQRQHQD